MSPFLAKVEAIRKALGRRPASVGKSILFKWPVVGWCVGQVVERNTDAFKTIDG